MLLTRATFIIKIFKIHLEGKSFIKLSNLPKLKQKEQEKY
ncbi:hypothetical protein NEOC95_000469 [Neochlamydia sp. AcF95]|nr:hypothetical protein [Neochlamydia sp. AcF95]